MGCSGWSCCWRSSTSRAACCRSPSEVDEQLIRCPGRCGPCAPRLAASVALTKAHSTRPRAVQSSGVCAFETLSNSLHTRIPAIMQSTRFLAASLLRQQPVASSILRSRMAPMLRVQQPRCDHDQTDTHPGQSEDEDAHAGRWRTYAAALYAMRSMLTCAVERRAFRLVAPPAS